MTNPAPPRPAALVEAILYLKAQPLTLSAIADHARCDRQVVEEALIELMEAYAQRDSALEIVETENGYSLQLRENLHHLVQNLVPTDLGVAALRTLAVIAMRGPLSQTELVELRGSGAYQHVQELVERGMVTKRRLAGERSSRLQVTQKFYQYFEVDQLPAINIAAPEVEIA